MSGRAVLAAAGDGGLFRRVGTAPLELPPAHGRVSVLGTVADVVVPAGLPRELPEIPAHVPPGADRRRPHRAGGGSGGRHFSSASLRPAPAPTRRRWSAMACFSSAVG